MIGEPLPDNLEAATGAELSRLTTLRRQEYQELKARWDSTDPDWPSKYALDRRWAVLSSELSRREFEQQQLVRSLGKRYAHCTLDNFECGNDAQRRAIEQVKRLVSEFRTDPRPLILHGPSGTGKDHILAAACKLLVRDGIAGVRCTNGPGLFAYARDRMFGEDHDTFWLNSNNGTGLAEVPLLAISDPAGVSSALTGFEADTLYRLVDERYREALPTWVTANVASRSQMIQQLGGPTVDRLIDGALVIHCDWPSHRKRQQEQSS